jgi:predicted ATPase with chaperone activity
LNIGHHIASPILLLWAAPLRPSTKSKEGLRGAFATSSLQIPRKRIAVYLAPADPPKDDSGFELGVAAAILVAGNGPKIAVDKWSPFLGDKGLDGWCEQSVAKELLDAAAEKLDISAQSYTLTIKIGRTIADLAESDDNTSKHLAEAL